MPSSKEIISIKNGPYPDKVFVEGDTLGIGAEIHSFYWKKEFLEKHDYEPVAIISTEKCGLSRYHYRGLTIWKDYEIKNNKPITSFGSGWHTPILCSKQNITYSQPSDFIDHMKLMGYLLPKIKKMAKNSENYEQRGYVDKIDSDEVPSDRKFHWSKLDYYVLVAPFDTIDRLPKQISTKIREFLKNT